MIECPAASSSFVQLVVYLKPELIQLSSAVDLLLFIFTFLFICHFLHWELPAPA